MKSIAKPRSTARTPIEHTVDGLMGKYRIEQLHGDLVAIRVNTTEHY